MRPTVDTVDLVAAHVDGDEPIQILAAAAVENANDIDVRPRQAE
jgi:hypothetical protein